MSGKKVVYRPRNWCQYNKALVKRGDLMLWIPQEVLNMWYVTKKTGRRGASYRYSDLAILCASQIRFMYHLPLRATQGFLGSLFSLLNITHRVPCYSTICRRMKTLNVNIPIQTSDFSRHIVLDSTGMKVYGEGEWKVRTHGAGKRRTWRKIHLGIDTESQEITCSAISTNDFNDSELFDDCLSQLNAEEIHQVSADGAYDAKNCYQYCERNQIQLTVPPRKGARLKIHGNTKSPPHPRDETIRQIRNHGRKNWKISSGYTKRSLAETAMFRFKQAFTGMLSSRDFQHQANEVFIKCGIMNVFSKLGLPCSVPT